MAKTHCDICNRDFKNEESLAMHNSAKHDPSNSYNPEKKSSFKWFIIIGIAILLIAGFYYYKNLTGNSINNNEVQKITLGFKNNYSPNTIQVKSGIPVELTLDNSVRGCYRSFNIPALGISKNFLSSSDKLEFTPTEKGTFQFRCGMGMGTGTLIVS